MATSNQCYSPPVLDNSLLFEIIFPLLWVVFTDRFDCILFFHISTLGYIEIRVCETVEYENTSLWLNFGAASPEICLQICYSKTFLERPCFISRASGVSTRVYIEPNGKRKFSLTDRLHHTFSLVLGDHPFGVEFLVSYN